MKGLAHSWEHAVQSGQLLYGGGRFNAGFEGAVHNIYFGSLPQILRLAGGSVKGQERA